jgi:TRAP-type uncharacterized transport system fused permease subunit
MINENETTKISDEAPLGEKELLEEFERRKRNLQGWRYWLVAAIAIAASLFHLYTAAFGLMAAIYQRSIHWMLMGVLIFLLYRYPRNVPATASISGIGFSRDCS